MTTNTKENTASPSSQDDEIDLLDLVYTILDGKWLILFFMLISLALAFIYAFGKTPVYKADSLLQVESKKATVPGIEEMASLGLGGDDATVATEIEIIKSRKNIGKAIDALDLNIKATPKRIPLLGNVYKKFFNSDDIKKLPPMFKWLDDKVYPFAWGNEHIDIKRLEVPKHLLNKPLTIKKKDNKRFDLFFDGKLILSGKIGQYNSSKDRLIKVRIRSLSGLPGTKYIIQKNSRLSVILSLQKQIKASEKGKKTGIINLSMEGTDKKLITDILNQVSNTYLKRNKTQSSEEARNALKFLEEQIKPYKKTAEEAENRLKSYKIGHQTADISLEAQAILNENARIDTELQKLIIKRGELGLKYAKQHPIIQTIIAQERQLRGRKKKVLVKSSALPRTQQELVKLQTDYEVATKTHLELLNKIQGFNIAKASSLGNVYILDTAVTYEKPVKPKKSLILALGGLLGGMLGIVIVFLRKALHQTVTNPEILEKITGIPVYATIPFSASVKQSGGFKVKRQKKLLALHNSTDPAIESLRSLRTSLHFALLEAKNNIVMITGPSPGIGKSFISSNFAAVIGSADQKVLLIDADMRKGYFHKLFSTKVSPGLSELISKKASLEEATHTIDLDDGSFDIITRGQTPPNPSELLMNSSFNELLDEASQKYDLVLIDTPPVHAVTDQTIIGKHAGVTFMVVYYDQHNIKEIEYAVSRLAQSGIETKGFIFNGFVASKKRGRYGYGYGYGYNSYYGDYKSN